MKRTLSILLLIVSQTVHTQQRNIKEIFTAPIQVSGQTMTMGFHYAQSRTPPHIWGVSVGYQDYNQPAIPRETAGEVWLPDSMLVPDGRILPIRWVSQGSFQQCELITEVHLPKNLLTISDMAFQNCHSLRSICMPESMEVIFPRAFQGCDSIRRVTFLPERPPYTYSDDTFSNRTYQTATLVFPAQSAHIYLVEPTFSRFRHHAELLPLYEEVRAEN